MTKIWVYIATGSNSLFPKGTKPLPKPLLTYHQRCSVFTWVLCHRKCLWTTASPRGQWETLDLSVKYGGNSIPVCPCRVRMTATVVWVHSKQTGPMATIASKLCLLSDHATGFPDMWTCPHEITRWDKNNKDGGSCIEKSENVFIFLAFCIFCGFRKKPKKTWFMFCLSHCRTTCLTGSFTCSAPLDNGYIKPCWLLVYIY